MNRSAKQVVSAFLTALNEENFDKAEKCLAKDMLFDGVMGKRNSAHSYIRDMRKMRFKYDIQKIFVSGNEKIKSGL